MIDAFIWAGVAIFLYPAARGVILLAGVGLEAVKMFVGELRASPKSILFAALVLVCVVVLVATIGMAFPTSTCVASRFYDC